MLFKICIIFAFKSKSIHKVRLKHRSTGTNSLCYRRSDRFLIKLKDILTITLRFQNMYCLVILRFFLPWHQIQKVDPRIQRLYSCFVLSSCCVWQWFYCCIQIYRSNTILSEPRCRRYSSCSEDFLDGNWLVGCRSLLGRCVLQPSHVLCVLGRQSQQQNRRNFLILHF